MKVSKDCSDEELLQRYRGSCKPEYLVELYGRYVPLVYGVALKYLKNVEDARDMVMQVYEELGGRLLQHEVKVFKGGCMFVSGMIVWRSYGGGREVFWWNWTRSLWIFAMIFILMIRGRRRNGRRGCGSA